MRVHQLNSCLAFGDAITNHTLELHKVLTKWGFDSDIFSEIISDDSIKKFAKEDRRYYKYINNKEDILLFHYSIYCNNIGMYKSSDNIKIFEYHNITPPDFVKGYDEYLYKFCKKGRDELRNLTNCDLCIGDSEYNRRELIEHGFIEAKSEVLPIFLHYEDYDHININDVLYEKYNDGYINILFVGRVAPNKKFEDIIKTFHALKRINKKSRLFLVGSKFLSKYDNKLINLIRNLNLDDVYFTDRVSLSDLKTYYKLATIFLCMSEHEGFCVPLIESMYFRVPIVAYNSSAIPYTLGNSGILINDKDYLKIAELIDILSGDTRLKARIIDRQSERLNFFERINVENKMKKIIERAANQD
jgi:L-malate glycosyltransferase